LTYRMKYLALRDLTCGDHIHTLAEQQNLNMAYFNPLLLDEYSFS